MNILLHYERFIARILPCRHRQNTLNNITGILSCGARVYYVFAYYKNRRVKLKYLCDRLSTTRRLFIPD